MTTIARIHEARKGQSMVRVASQMGISEHTLRRFLAGGNVSKETRRRINAWLTQNR